MEQAVSLLPKSSNGFLCWFKNLLTSLKNQSSVSSGPQAKEAGIADTEVPGKKGSQREDAEGANPISCLFVEVKGTELFCFK